MVEVCPKSSVIVALVAIVAAADAAAEDYVELYPLQWEASVEFDGTWRKTGDQKTRDREVETGVRFRQDGFSLDPRIFRFSVEVEPRVSRGDFTGAGQDETRDGLFVNYNVTANALQGTPGPFAVNAQASQTTDTTEGSLGNRSDFDLQTRSLSVNWKTRVFPSTLTYSERLLDQTFESGLTGAVSERDDALRTISFRGRSSKMDVTLARDWLDDQTDRDLDYTSNRGSASHRFNWGKGSELTSRVNYFDRTGFNTFKRFTLDETARVQHLENLRSTTSYQFTLFERQDTTIENSGTFALTHDLYSNLTTTGHVSASNRTSDLQTEDEYEAGLDASYRKEIIWGGRLNVSAGGAYRITDRRSDAGTQGVVDESHVIPATGLVILDRRFVVPGSVIVTDVTGTLVLLQGTDYDVTLADGDLAQIFIFPGGPIATGQTILVSYSFELLPTLKFSTVPYNFRASVDYGWISVFHHMSGSNESLISGEGESLLIDRENRTTGLQLTWDGRNTRAIGTAQHRVERTGDFEVESLDFGQSVFYTVSPRFSANLGLSEVFSESRNRSTDLYTVDVSARWRPQTNLTLRPHVGYWLRDDEGEAVAGGSRREDFIFGGISLGWTWRALELSLRYDQNRRSGDVTGSTEHRLMFTLLRRSL